MPKELNAIYKKLSNHFGPRRWWPGDSDLEVCIGAVLTQNTAWKNVEKAIANLKKSGKLELPHLTAMPEKKLAALIKPSGYYNLKAKRLRALLNFLASCNSGDWRGYLRGLKLETAREKLLSVYGIGPETADSILLYAAQRRTFVIDAYTLRFGGRYGIFPQNTNYESAREYFMNKLPRKVKLYNEYHALIVALGHNYCKPKPLCNECPLGKNCAYAQTR
ncbi:MAG: endonuclease III domain-containing protein [Nitrospinota bacterium]